MDEGYPIQASQCFASHSCASELVMASMSGSDICRSLDNVTMSFRFLMLTVDFDMQTCFSKEQCKGSTDPPASAESSAGGQSAGCGGSQGLAGSGAAGRCMGASVRKVSLKSSAKLPAQASRL
eukprot:2945483-Amphidinium_carterae.1